MRRAEGNRRNHRPRHSRVSTSLVLRVGLPVLAAAPLARAASATWSTTPTNGSWEAVPGEINWSTGDGTFPGNVTGTSTTDAATFSGISSFTSVAIDSTAGNTSPLNIGTVIFTGATTSNFTIGSTTGNALVVTSNASVTSSPANQIVISGTGRASATAAVTETVDAPIVLAPQSSTTAGFYAFQNNSTALSSADVLVFDGPISGGTTTQGITLNVLGSNTNTANTINGVISDGGAGLGVGVTKSGSGVWTLAGANTYTGATTASGGNLRITGTNSSNGSYVANSGGTITIASSGTVQASTVTLNGGSSNFTITSGTVVANSVTSSAAAGSNGRFLNLNGGILKVASDIGISGGVPTNYFVINLNGGTLYNNKGSTLNIATNAQSPSGTVGNIVVGANGGTLDTTAGDIALYSATLLGGFAAGPVTVQGDNTLFGGVSNNGVLNLAGTSKWDLNGVASSVGGLSGTGTVLNSGAVQTLTLNVGTGAQQTFSGNIAPAAPANVAVVKSGAGTQVLTGTNTYEGGTTLNGGVLSAGSAGAIGTTGAINFGGGTLQYTAGNATDYSARIAAGTSSGSVSVNTNGQDVTFATALTANQSGGLTKSGAGSLTLAAATAYTGPTTVNAGKLALVDSLTTSSSVTVNGGRLELSSGGGSNRVINTPGVAVSGTGRLDLMDNKLVTATPTGTWTGSAYTDVTGLVAAGRNGGDWAGSGIVTSLAANNADYTSLGVANATDVKGLTGTATDTFAGQTVHAGDTLVMYTYGGDANLDGVVNIDDYTQIDSSTSVGGALKGWFNGDFNYDGNVDIDDYTIIDSNIAIQGAPFPTAVAATGSPAGAFAVTAVPEPASISLIALAIASLSQRRRRRSPL